MGKVVKHPASALMDEVKAERAIVDTPEAEVLMEAVTRAVSAYFEYLDRHGLFYDEKRDLMRASALRVICSVIGDIEIGLEDGALDRRYGSGKDPDPECRGLNPTWPPPKVPRSQS